jgi:hypothetical protein
MNSQKRNKKYSFKSVQAEKDKLNELNQQLTDKHKQEVAKQIQLVHVKSIIFSNLFIWD